MNKEMETLLKRQEGLRLRPYHCTAGKLTIGYGHNLEEGISQKVADLLFEEDLIWVKEACSKYSWFSSLNEIRQGVIINMMFNLGEKRFSGFKRMIESLEEGKFELASFEMLDSLWSKQVGSRAIELSQLMRDGEIKRYS